MNKDTRLEEKFNFFVSHALAVITIIAKDGTILYQSPSIKQILGYESNNRIGKNFLRSRIVHPEDVRIKTDLLKRAINTPDKNFKGELRMLHKNGTWSWMEVIFNNQLSNPNIGGIIVITHDITERKLAELQKDTLLGITSHELKTPITSLKAYTQILIKKTTNTDEKSSREILEKMEAQITKISTLIEDLLDVSKAESGILKLHKTKFNFNDLIRETIEEIQQTTDTHQIIFKTKNKKIITADRERIGQVLANLLTNAIKYSPKKSQIIISTTPEKNTITTSVKDFGTGISKDDLQFVFNKFFRASKRKTETIPGVGLGLYIASEIIKLHDGKIWVKSQYAKGSTFYFSLPL